MSDINRVFCRKLLSMIHRDVRRAFPNIRDVRKVVGVTSSMRNQYFVQISVTPHPIFNIDVRADNADDARYKAWSKFLAKYAPAEFHDEVMERSA